MKIRVYVTFEHTFERGHNVEQNWSWKDESMWIDSPSQCVCACVPSAAQSGQHEEGEKASLNFNWKLRVLDTRLLYGYYHQVVNPAQP